MPGPVGRDLNRPPNKKTRQLLITLPVALADFIDEESADGGRSISEVVGQAIAVAIDVAGEAGARNLFELKQPSWNMHKGFAGIPPAVPIKIVFHDT